MIFVKSKLFKIRFFSGQTIIEVLFAVGVISICLVALMAAITSAVNNARFAKNSGLANKYAQEAVEVARRLRDRNSWSDFTSNFNGNMCFDSEASEPNGLCDTSCAKIDNIFTRCINFNNNSEKMTITVNVSWDEGGRSHQIQTVTFLTKWNN